MKSAFKLLLVSVWLVGFRSSAVAQPSTAEQNPSVTVPTNIHQLFVDDQAERNVRGFTPKYASDVRSRDAVRRAEARKLLAAGELKSAQDFHDAAFIFQHGSDPDDYLLAHILAIDAIVKGDASSRWIAAATLDRYLQAIGQKQVFGTQYLNKGFLYLLQHKDDPNAAKSAEAQQKGMTQEPYDRTLVSDALRSEFNVPDQAAQATKLIEMNADKPSTGGPPPASSH
ncbi:MAG TPA: hypothetical protein VMT38_12575 [Terracidiphilus sp.]|nr:hypothetical protein [Terracidiphilus sp.]